MSTSNIYHRITFTTLLLISNSLFAHGGAATEDDLCIMKLGRYNVHLSTYEAGKGDEYCYTLPTAGDTILVFDFVDEALRKKAIDIRLLETTGNDSHHNDGMKTVLHLPAKTYTAGTVHIEANLQENKHYIAQVRLAESKSRMVEAEISVVRPSLLGNIFGSFFLLILSGFVYLLIKKPEQLKSRLKAYQAKFID